MATDSWQIRREGSRSAGRTVSYETLSVLVADGVCGEVDEVRGPGEARWRLIGEHPRTAELVPLKVIGGSRTHEEADPDMTPMIDVTFQLVIFFMIAATYTVQKTLDLPSTKPDPDKAAAVTMDELEQTSVIVKVKQGESITVGDEVVALEDLPRALENAIRESSTAELVLDVDDDVVHNTVVKVLDAAGAASIEKVLFVSRQSSPAAE